MKSRTSFAKLLAAFLVLGLFVGQLFAQTPKRIEKKIVIINGDTVENSTKEVDGKDDEAELKGLEELKNIEWKGLKELDSALAGKLDKKMKIVIKKLDKSLDKTIKKLEDIDIDVDVDIDEDTDGKTKNKCRKMIIINGDTMTGGNTGFHFYGGNMPPHCMKMMKKGCKGDSMACGKMKKHCYAYSFGDGNCCKGMKSCKDSTNCKGKSVCIAICKDGKYKGCSVNAAGKKCCKGDSAECCKNMCLKRGKGIFFHMDIPGDEDFNWEGLKGLQGDKTAEFDVKELGNMDADSLIQSLGINMEKMGDGKTHKKAIIIKKTIISQTLNADEEAQVRKTLAQTDEKLAKSDFKTLNLYPNPTDGEVTLKFESKGSEKWNISVYDMNGKLLQKENIQTNMDETAHSFQIGQPNGNYIVVVSNGQKVFTGKVTVNK